MILSFNKGPDRFRLTFTGWHISAQTVLWSLHNVIQALKRACYWRIGQLQRVISWQIKFPVIFRDKRAWCTMKTQCNFQNSKLPSQKGHLLKLSDRKTLSCYTVWPRLFCEFVLFWGFRRDYFEEWLSYLTIFDHHSKHVSKIGENIQHCCSFHVQRKCFLEAQQWRK